MPFFLAPLFSSLFGGGAAATGAGTAAASAGSTAATGGALGSGLSAATNPGFMSLISSAAQQGTADGVRDMFSGQTPTGANLASQQAIQGLQGSMNEAMQPPQQLYMEPSALDKLRSSIGFGSLLNR